MYILCVLSLNVNHPYFIPHLSFLIRFPIPPLCCVLILLSSTPRYYRTDPFVLRRDSVEDNEKEENNKVPTEITGVRITTKRIDPKKGRTVEKRFEEDPEHDSVSSLENSTRDFQKPGNTTPVNDDSQENDDSQKLCVNDRTDTGNDRTDTGDRVTSDSNAPNNIRENDNDESSVIS